MKAAKGSFYRKSLLIILLVASIPGLITGVAIYVFAVGTIEHDLMALHSKQMQQRVRAINDQFSYLEQGLSHWAFDPRFGSRLKNTDFSLRIIETKDLVSTLLILQGSHPLIERVQLYIKGPALYLFDPEFTQLSDNTKLQSQYEQLLSRPDKIFWTSKPIVLRGASQDGPAKTEPVIMLARKIHGDLTESFGVLAVSLKSDRLHDLLLTLTPYHEGATFLMNENKEMILSTNKGVEAQVFERSLREDIFKAGGKAGSYVKEWRGTTYSVSYGTFDRLSKQWTYVSAAPMSAITYPVVMASKTIFIISALMLLTALVLSWVASRKIYTPVERLVRLIGGDKAAELRSLGMDEFKLLEKRLHHLNHESTTLQLRLEEELPRVKEGFLLQLIQGHLHAYSEKDLRERMRHYGWAVSRQQFTFVGVQLTGLSRLEDRFLAGDEGLVTFAAANIIEELAAEHLKHCSVLNFHNLSVGMLVITPMDEPQNESIHALSEALTQAINKHIKLMVTVTISRPTLLVKTIPDLFQDVMQAASYRLFKDENQIIRMDDLSADVYDHNNHYPFALDREISQAIRMGEWEAAERLIDQFLDEVSRAQKEYLVQQSVLQLFGSIQYIILQSGLQPHLLFGGCNMFERLAQIREPAKLTQWFKEEVVRPYRRHLEERSNLQLKRVVEQTMQLLQTQFMTDVSLESCARLTGTTPYTLSRAFKHIAGINFVDYLTQLRIDRAKELLRTTDLKINDVAEQIGYQHSYFNRIFKKYEGVTPSQYREK
ncbi:AraC family transcriptional regulator [Paenibacillus alkalitolerans]|uniref:AraC family transcriptional regulator n=1 Tax=Paenibacillus alkalitolerans TaxID=2799335 RepID=UPI001F294A4B|nr:AraC family transcriptional regulator [Paenibacillus alkalitolerans]